MEPIIDVIKGSGEPEWLEKTVVGELRVWHFMFICLAGITTISKYNDYKLTVS